MRMGRKCNFYSRISVSRTRSERYLHHCNFIPSCRIFFHKWQLLINTQKCDHFLANWCTFHSFSQLKSIYFWSRNKVIGVYVMKCKKSTIIREIEDIETLAIFLSLNLSKSIEIVYLVCKSIICSRVKIYGLYLLWKIRCSALVCSQYHSDYFSTLQQRKRFIRAIVRWAVF